MDLQLEGQIAVVAGGAGGIGLAIARGFAREGARVALLDTAAETAEAASRLSGETSVDVIDVACDVTSFPAVEEARDTVLKRLGDFDHVVDAAAVGSGKFGYPFLNLVPGDWPRVLEVNILGAVHLAHAFAPRLIEKRAGTFLLLGSVAGQFGSQTDPPYSASKAALFNFCQCMAKDLAPYGIRVNTVNPGMVKTSLNRSVWESWNRRQPAGKQRSYEDWADEKVRQIIPLGRWQDAEDMAAMAVFLSSPRAGNITGQTINVDGGYVMR